MPKMRQSRPSERRVTVRERTPISGEMGGTRDTTTTETYRNRQPRSRPASSFLPTSAGKTTGSSIGVLEAEFLACLVLIFLTVFTDQQSSYSAKMLAVMKRGTLASVLFFVLALMSTGGENVARFAKAMGALVLVAIFLSTAGQGTVSAMDAFFKADWTTGDTTQGDSSSQAPAGTQQPITQPSSPSAKDRAISAFQKALDEMNRIMNLPGFGFIK